MAFLTFKEIPKPESRKTKLFSVLGIGGCLLGKIAWHAHWRCYTFQEAHGVHEWVFDAKCLREIADFLDKLMAERKGGAVCEVNNIPKEDCISCQEDANVLPPTAIRCSCAIPNPGTPFLDGTRVCIDCKGVVHGSHISRTR